MIDIYNNRIRYIYPEEIPSKYTDGLILLNPDEGDTTLAYSNQDKEFSYIFTKDALKVKYLTTAFENKISDLIDQFKTESNILPDLKDMDIYVLKMEYLEKIEKGTENKKIAKEVSKIFDKIINHIAAINNIILGEVVRHYTKEITSDIYIYLCEKYPNLNIKTSKDIPDKADSIAYFIYNFFKNYKDFQYSISPKQFMQFKNGEIILLDPIISSNLEKKIIIVK